MLYLYMFITIPGEQKPHWEPFFPANAACRVWNPSFLLPKPSIVLMAHLKKKRKKKKCQSKI